MCGIVAVVRRPDERPVLGLAEVEALLAPATAAMEGADRSGDVDGSLRAATAPLVALERSLRGVSGVRALVHRPAVVASLIEALERIDGRLAGIEAAVETLDPDRLEAANAALVDLRDVLWSLRVDRLRTASAVEALLAGADEVSAIAGYLSIHEALAAIDRLEVRGRDSAGMVIVVAGHGLDARDPALAARAADPLLRSGSIRWTTDAVGFVVKAAAEIGELGDNTASMRAAIVDDELLRRALRAPGARATVLAHTRWASVGVISEPNAHPVDSLEGTTSAGPVTFAVLNGDVDNHADLRALARLDLAPEITTDAKVIPTLLARTHGRADDALERFRSVVSELEGSVAIASVSLDDAATVELALRGSGQALYVGLGDDCTMVASEPYGLVETTSRYLRVDGDRTNRPGVPASRGQVLSVTADDAGTIAGVRRRAYDGTALPVDPEELVVPTITTRDIDRGDHPHFLLKEIGEAPRSLRATLRGRLVEVDGVLGVRLGDDVIPPEVRERIVSGEVRRVVVIGHGTAAVAGRSLVTALGSLGSALAAEAQVASEFCGPGMVADLTDTLVVAISQSGTTTDTNRAVDLATARGASVIAIVNRRGSDLTDKAHGVLYTSDGRDVEMSVASTKAFYAQVAAGSLLAVALAQLVGAHDRSAEQALLRGLRELPDAMHEVIARRADIAVAADRFCPERRHWAVVGSGANLIAAAEIRIKLSELCYAAIPADVTEDKKHIDLSSEPLVVVCAAGLTGSAADDVAKEVAIYRAHKAAPIVIASDGDERFRAAHHVIAVPDAGGPLAFVLATVAGHLFGYEAALSIDAQARQLRELRAGLDHAAEVGSAEVALAEARDVLEAGQRRFADQLRAGRFDGHLSTSAATNLASVLRYATGLASLDAYALEHGKVGTPAVVVDDLTAALTRAIEELTRPIDAIKHQAKTVTVGISRADEGLLANRLVRAVLDVGAPRDRLSYRTLKVLGDLEPAVALVLGATRYRIDGDPEGDDATIAVVDRSGIGLELVSRTDRSPVLRGTKRRVAAEREVFCAIGRSDARSLVIVPEAKGTRTTGLTLLHVRFTERLEPAVARSVLAGYRNRYAALVDAVMETEPAFRDDLLGDLDVVTLLTEPINPLADRWRA